MSLLNDSNPFHCRCEVCGHEMFYLADPPPPEPSAEDLEPVELAIHWKDGGATFTEFVALRQFVTDLRDRPTAEVYAAVRQSKKWPLGVVERRWARVIRERAARVGLVVEIESAVGAEHPGPPDTGRENG
jgi:hypothetical protein